jgi:hypothetical protein
MSSDELADAILDSPAFVAALRTITARAVLAEMPAIRGEEPDPVDWSWALRSASALTGTLSEPAQDAALRVAQSCLSDRTAEPGHHVAAALLLERLGNRPSLDLATERDLVAEQAWANAPAPLRLDVVRRRLELAIPTSAGETLHGNPFQRDFWTNAEAARWISVSAPTSAGKSYIVKKWFGDRLQDEELRGVYVVPTRALIDEVMADLEKAFDATVALFAIPWDEEIGKQSQEIHVVTQERFHLLQQRFPDFSADLIFVDEAQKFGDGQRGVLLQRVLDEAVRRNEMVQVIFASPLTENPEILLSAAPASAESRSLISETITVNQNLLWANQVPRRPKEWQIELVTAGEPSPLGVVTLAERPTAEGKRLAFIAVAMGGDDTANLVYVNGAAEAEKTALQIADARGANADVSDNADIAALRELVQKTIHPNYALIDAINRGVAFHYGNMPLLVRGEIERLFRSGTLQYLVCTSTLLEGVNLPCRNLFARGPKRGNKTIMSPGDFWNLAGRAGRWGHEFQGNIVCIDTSDPKRWPAPPRKRVRQPLARATDPVVHAVPSLLSFIAAGTPPPKNADSALMESVFSFLAVRAGAGVSVSSLPGMEGMTSADAEALDNAVEESLLSVELPYDVYARNAGISPLSMQRLLEYFRAKKKQEELLLAPPESDDAAETYVRALGRVTQHLGAPFGPSGRDWVLAILIADWMRGRPLALLISRRNAYWASKGDDKIATHIRSTMMDVEQVARFEAPKYLGCYSDVLRFHLETSGQTALLGEMFDLTMMLELGVSTDTELALMTLGLSRTSAIALSSYIAGDKLTRDECLAWLNTHDLAGLDLPALVRREVNGILDNAASGTD